MKSRPKIEWIVKEDVVQQRKIACPPHIPVFILANSRRAELRRVWLAREKQILFTLAQHVLSVARVIAEILLMDFANDERVP